MKHLFVVGLGRSGTTALGQIIGAHSSVVMGMERFKFLWDAKQIDRLRPRLFTEDRFFDFENSRFTNVTPATPKWARYYEQGRKKFPTATYIGDKITQPATIPALRGNFPDARFIFLVRDIREVAHSWEARASNPDDSAWAATRNARAAVAEWNSGLQTMLDEYEDHPHKVTLVDYTSFFGADNATPLRDILRALRLSMEDRIRTVYKGGREAYEQKIAGKPRPLSSEVQAHIAEAADFALWERYRVLCTRQPADAAPEAAVMSTPSPHAVEPAQSHARGQWTGPPQTTEPARSPALRPRPEQAEGTSALPNLLVAGTQKAGTTWLHAQLAKHPDIFMSDVKEIGYFNDAGHVENPESLSEYRAHFAPGVGMAYRGESTPHYFWRRDQLGVFSPHGKHDVASFAQETLGSDVRILVSLRDPVSRAISGFFHNIAMGRFGVEQSIFRCPPAMGIVDLGFYERHWQHWSDIFGAAHIHALLFDDLEAAPNTYLASALDFLGLEADQTFWASLDTAKLGERPRMNKLKKTESQISPQEIAALLNLYYDDIRFVERLTGRDLAAWRDLDLLVDRHCVVHRQT